MAKKEKKAKNHFLKDFKAELKKVIWPTPKQLANNTIAVIGIVLLTAVIVFVLDVVFESMNKYGISNLQNIVNERFNNEENNNQDSNNVEENINVETENDNSEENNTTVDESTTNTQQ